MARMFMHIVAALAAIAGTSSLLKAEEYPVRTIRIVIPNSPGGPSDLITRLIAKNLGTQFGQPVIVENKPGANGLIAGTDCARAKPDGYTICLQDSFNVVLNPLITPEMPYDPMRDLAPVIHIGFLPSGLWAKKSLQVSNVRELLLRAKDRRQPLNFATFGSSSSSDLYVNWLTKNGYAFQKVAYKSAVDAFRAVLSGEADVSVYGLSSGLTMKTDAISLLGVSTEQRLAQVPAVETFGEGGLNVSIVTWFALFTQNKVPADIVDKLNKHIGIALRSDQDIVKSLDTLGIAIYGPAATSTTALSQFLIEQTAIYQDLVRKDSAAQ